jgi:two-component system, OmpR family, sensor histidine kinase CpxA
VRSLFIRIFLWFWAATVLLAAVLVGTVYLTEPDNQGPHWRTLTRSFLNLYSTNAVTAYERHGCAELNAFFRRHDPFRDTTHRRFLTDDSGRNLCGPALPAPIETLAREAGSSSAPLLRHEERESISATPVSGPSKKLYVLVFDVPHPRPPMFPVSPETWTLRILALLATAGLVCYALARYFAAPVRRLRAVARRFAAGDLRARVGDDSLLKRRDEVSELGKDFDEMAQRIEELVTRQDKLLQSQRRLLGDISHELRSPLTRLALASELLKRRVGEEAKPLLSRIDRESERLKTLISQLLTLARLDATPGPEAAEILHLNEMLVEVIEDASFEAGAKNVRIELSASRDCFLSGTRDLLCGAFENILRNAVHYTAENTRITVELKCNSISISVIVSDEGPGVPEADLPHVFEPFYRVAEARDRQSGGAGLGLAITERTVRVHGGVVEAMNRPKGGLSVCVTFPVVDSVIPEPSTASTATAEASA